MPDRIYCYPDSNVLKNRMGVRDSERLSQLEKRLTMLRLLELIDKPIKGKFDLKHLQAIHKYIFQDVYEWAGEINALHPFREGNGRSQREFIRCLALYNGYVVNFANVCKEEMMKASEESFLCNYGAMEQLFKKCIRRK